MGRHPDVSVEVRPIDDHYRTALDDLTVPPDLADAIQSAFGLAESPATLADWVTAVSRLLDDSELSVGVEELCTAAESRHVAQLGGHSQHFHCVLDTLLVPFLLPGEAPVDVRSRSPVSDDRVELTVAPDAVEVTPSSAVMSFGLADGLAVPDPADIEPTLAYQWVCPYINAFTSRAEYDQWVRETPAVSTMALSFPAGLELARVLAQRPQYEDD